MGVGPHPISITLTPDFLIPLIKELTISKLESLPSLQTTILLKFLLREQNPLPIK